MTDNRDDTDSDSLSNEIVRALGKELKRLRAAHRGAEARIHNFEANHMDLETKYGNLIATAHDLDVSHEALMQEHADLKARRTELEKENVWLQQELDGTRRSLQGIKVEREEPCILTAANHYDKVKRALDESTKRREEEKLEHVTRYL
ncbi:hypothetical protein DAEQUDRAFT_732643 [Daedalea quercina L-15889]|uniref:Uncharacterized protein n=1 Tax=Daedalea quercina L-15889 TaxID=1314783 RepID=A0A165LHB5_9APHY|nr:hypothetical protein DAEQUDRAFT_732643 [Daedalea quercina L-15889]